MGVLHPVARGVQTCAAAGIRIVTAEQWGAAFDYSSKPERPIDVDGGQGFTHWFGPAVSTAAAAGDHDEEARWVRVAEDTHLRRGYQGGAYDVLFGNSGSLYLMRTDSRSAATAGDVDRDGISNNDEGDAGAFILGEGQKPSPAALRTADLFWNGHGIGALTPHRDGRGTATECPGPDLTPWARSWSPSRQVASAPPVRHYAQAVVYDAAAKTWDGPAAAVLASTEGYNLGLVEWRDRQLLSVTHPGHVADVGFAFLVGLANSTVSRRLFPDGTNRVGSLNGEPDDRWSTVRDVARTLVAHPPETIERRGKPW